jgi:hypothetical protein
VQRTGHVNAGQKFRLVLRGQQFRGQVLRPLPGQVVQAGTAVLRALVKGPEQGQLVPQPCRALSANERQQPPGQVLVAKAGNVLHEANLVVRVLRPVL